MFAYIFFFYRVLIFYETLFEIAYFQKQPFTFVRHNLESIFYNNSKLLHLPSRISGLLFFSFNLWLFWIGNLKYFYFFTISKRTRLYIFFFCNTNLSYCIYVYNGLKTKRNKN